MFGAFCAGGCGDAAGAGIPAGAEGAADLSSDDGWVGVGFGVEGWVGVVVAAGVEDGFAAGRLMI